MFYGKELIVMSMLYPAMNKLTQYIPNRYMMVNVVARPKRRSPDSIWTRSP